MQAVMIYDEQKRLQNKKLGDTGLECEADATVIVGVRKNAVGRMK